MMNNTRTNGGNFFAMLRSSILLVAFRSALGALHFAQELGDQPSPAATAAATSPKNAVQVKRSIQHPVLDVDKMSEDEVRDALKRMQASASRDFVTKTIRFNDGSETTHYEKGEKMRDGKIAKGGEVNSARDSGTLSIYGFGRNPVSLYLNQWIELFQFCGAVLQFGYSNLDHINDYVAKRLGNSARYVDASTIEQVAKEFGITLALPEAEGNGGETESAEGAIETLENEGGVAAAAE